MKQILITVNHTGALGDHGLAEGSLCPSVCLCWSYLWRFEGVVCGEVNGQKEYPALVRTVVLQ